MENKWDNKYDNGPNTIGAISQVTCMPDGCEGDTSFNIEVKICSNPPKELEVCATKPLDFENRDYEHINLIWRGKKIKVTYYEECGFTYPGNLQLMYFEVRDKDLIPAMQPHEINKVLTVQGGKLRADRRETGRLIPEHTTKFISCKTSDYIKQIKSKFPNEKFLYFKSTREEASSMSMGSSRMYLVANGILKGYLNIIDVKCGPFACTKSGTKLKGYYLVTTKKFTQVKEIAFPEDYQYTTNNYE